MASDGWRELAACAGSPPEWWDEDSAPTLRHRGARVCARCPVADACLADAVATGSVGVVRAGRYVGRPGNPPVPDGRDEPAVARTGPRRLRGCGSHAAYQRHIARGEEPCARCRRGEREYQAAAKADRVRRSCGTRAGYDRHRGRGEPACRACLDAAASRVAAGREANLGRPARDIPHGMSGYNDWECRCPVCRAAMAAYRREYRARRRRGAGACGTTEGYYGGCRCAPCTAAKAEAQRRYRARKRERDAGRVA